MDASTNPSNLESSIATEAAVSPCDNPDLKIAVGTPSDDPSNLRKRADVITSIGRSGLVVIAGAGVCIQSVGKSTPSTAVAGWPGLLTHGVEYCLKHQLLQSDEADLVRRQISIGVQAGKTSYLIEAAQRINDSLDKRINGRYWWLYDSIGQLTVDEPRLIRAIQGLGGLIATLNYDDLIERVTGWNSVEWHQSVEVTRCMHDRERNIVLHLHGHWKQPGHIILDRLSYERIKCHQDTLGLLRDFARNYTLLFVGCGDTFFDPNFQTLLAWAEEALKGVQHRHYVLCRQSDEPRLFMSLQQHGYLDSLVYGSEYSDLSPFLEEIGEEGGASAKATNPPVSEGTPRRVTSESGSLKPLDIWKQKTQL